MDFVYLLTKHLINLLYSDLCNCVHCVMTDIRSAKIKCLEVDSPSTGLITMWSGGKRMLASRFKKTQHSSQLVALTGALHFGHTMKHY